MSPKFIEACFLCADIVQPVNCVQILPRVWNNDVVHMWSCVEIKNCRVRFLQ